jgi:hypothetical protein
MVGRRLFPCIVACAVFPFDSQAREPVRVSLEPVPLHVQGEISPVFVPDLAPGSSSVSGDSLVYSNTHYNFYSPLAWFPPGEGITFADDLHLTLPGRLTQFWFFYHEPYQNLVRITASFYANEGDDDRVGRLLAGPYSLGPFRWGAYRVHVTVQDTVFLDQDVWFALRFESWSAGAVLANPPFVGGSHDVYYDFDSGQTSTFVGALANIYLQVRVDPESVGVETATWSQVKALYRAPPGRQSGDP